MSDIHGIGDRQTCCVGILNDTHSGVEKAHADVAVREASWGRTAQFVVGSFGLDSVVLKEGSIPDRCYEIRE